MEEDEEDNSSHHNARNRRRDRWAEGRGIEIENAIKNVSIKGSMCIKGRNKESVV